ncbi:hypothetical protein GIB67_011945 [Kingdonia uniflora]|uniref:Uncharacterized protein n=1 Tax=Kingdonia uniflora TaxID=39325 RepID=A0A7J7M043_9MAGN|nr:hypothetical protein GIB67_011945 [Kingdonia uniflora]
MSLCNTRGMENWNQPAGPAIEIKLKRLVVEGNTYKVQPNQMEKNNAAGYNATY